MIAEKSSEEESERYYIFDDGCSIIGCSYAWDDNCHCDCTRCYIIDKIWLKKCLSFYTNEGITYFLSRLSDLGRNRLLLETVRYFLNTFKWPEEYFVNYSNVLLCLVSMMDAEHLMSLTETD